MDVRFSDLHFTLFRQIFVCKYGLPPRSIIYCNHGNKELQPLKRAFLCIPRGAIVAFWSSLLFRLLDGVLSEVCIDRLLCCLIVGIQASEISIPLSLLMFLVWSLIWIASLTLSIDLTLLQLGIYLSLTCSETVKVWVRANRMSLSCSLILSRIDLSVSPINTLLHSHEIL